MPEILKLILNSLLFFCLVACNEGSDMVLLLNKAEMYMSEKPDSALSLLDSIIQPEDLSNEQYALWCLLYTQAQDKNWIEHTSDSIINVAVEYFREKNDLHRKAQAYYCQGRVLSEMDASAEALEAYLNAQTFVKQTSDYDLNARICNHLGSLYWENRNDSASLICYEDAHKIYTQCLDTVGMINTLRNMAMSRLSLGQLDSAYIQLQLALKLAEEGNINSQKAYIYSSLGNLYEEQGDYEKALAYNKESLKYLEKESMFLSWYYSIGVLYKKMQMPDSAFFYAEKALASPNLYVECSANHLLCDLSVESQSYEKACLYSNRYLLLRDSIEDLYQPQKLAKIEALYNKERLINKQNQEKEKARNIRDFLFACILIIGVVSYLVYNREREKRKEQQKKAEESQKKYDEISKRLDDSVLTIEQKDSVLNEIRELLAQNEREIADYKERINGLEDNTSAMQEKYQSELNEKLDENKKLSASLETTLEEKRTLISQKESLLHEKDELYSIWKNEKSNMENELLRIKQEQNDNLLRLESEKNNKEALVRELEDLRAQREEQRLCEENVIKDLSLKCKMYEEWGSSLIRQNSYLSKFIEKTPIQKLEEKDWEIFFQNFETVFPGFIDHLNNLYSMDQRPLQICCLLKLGLKNNKISEIYDLRPDTVTSQKAEIKKKYFSEFGKQSLDNILKKWY